MNIDELANVLMWTGITVTVYALSIKVYRLSKNIGLLHPIIFSVVVIFGVVYLTKTPLEDYQQGTQILTWLLLPATVALAVPLYNQLPLLKQLGLKLVVPILIGGAVAPFIAVGIIWLAGLDISLLASTLTKSITTPLAIETTRAIGGIPALAAIMVIVTGLFGVMICGAVFSFANVKSEMFKGLALGTAAHALGTAHAASIGNVAVGFATLALCINGIATSLCLTVGLWLTTI